MRAPTADPTFTERARRAQIVRAAIDTVNELGYPKASIAAIARRAGVAKSAIVYYFDTKDALLLHVVDDVFTALDAALQRAVASHDDPESRLRAYAEGYLAHVDAHRAGIAAGAEIVVSHRRADGVPLYLTGTEEDTVLLRAILADGMERGVFRAMPIPIAASLIESLLDLATNEVQRDLSADLSALLPEIVEFIIRSIAPTS